MSVKALNFIIFLELRLEFRVCWATNILSMANPKNFACTKFLVFAKFFVSLDEFPKSNLSFDIIHKPMPGTSVIKIVPRAF